MRVIGVIIRVLQGKNVSSKLLNIHGANKTNFHDPVCIKKVENTKNNYLGSSGKYPEL